jgi:hypothetical protein
MAATQSYSPKDPAESILLSWDFSPLLSPTETIVTPTWDVTDPENALFDQTTMKSGGPIVIGPIVYQRLIAGPDGQSLRHRIQIVTSLGNTFVEKPTQLVTSE